MVNNASDSTWRASIAGSYGTFISDHINKINVPFWFLDFGANQGLFSLVAALNSSCRRVIAFEANPDTFAFLVRNVGLSPYRRKILPYCGAVVDGIERPVDLRVPSRHSGGASITRDMKDGEAELIRTLGIGPALLGELCAIPDGVDVRIKVDVEGAELHVLKALQAGGILKRVNTAVVEVSEHVGGPGHSESVVNLLSAAGLDLVRRSNGSKHFDGLFERRLH